MIRRNRLRPATPQPRVAQPHRQGAGAIVRFIVFILCGLAVVSCASVPAETPYNLGVAAFNEQNYSRAAAQWTKSAARGNTEAMNDLCYLLYNGYGVDRDTHRAVDLWRVAADAGDSAGQWHLGSAYETGIGVKRSLPEAYAWYQCAIETASSNSIAVGKDHDSEAAILKAAWRSLMKDDP
jgi:TPR repeat protein